MKSTSELIESLWDLSSRIDASGDIRGQELMAMIGELEKSIMPPQMIGGVPRSGKWHAVQQRHLELFPTCLACGSDTDLQVHHVKPFHEFPELELEPSNLITLCMKPYHLCHFVFGHVWSWSTNNPNVVADAIEFFELKARLRAK